MSELSKVIARLNSIHSLVLQGATKGERVAARAAARVQLVKLYRICDSSRQRVRLTALAKTYLTAADKGWATTCAAVLPRISDVMYCG